MNWSRAKTILIALLLAVDIFLLAVYITRENGARQDEMTVRADVCAILSAQGIEVAEELVPLDSVEIRPAMLYRGADAEKSAASLFGEVHEETGNGSVTYFGNGGSIMFSDESFSLVYESGKSIENESDALSLARSVAKSLAMTSSVGDYTCQSSDGGYTVKIPQMSSGVPVFDCGTELKISPAGSVIASGKFMGRGRLSQTGGEVMKASALMLSFADGAAAKQLLPLTVREVKLGYISKIPAAGSVSLAPTMRFSTDKGDFYVDMQSGKFAEI